MTQEQHAHSAQAVQMLAAQLGAAKVLSSGPAYDEARHVLNAAVTRRPAARAAGLSARRGDTTSRRAARAAPGADLGRRCPHHPPG
jgi:hypothetical protein